MCSTAVYFYEYVVQYFGEPTGQAKIQRTSTNIQQYYTPKCLMSYLLSICFDSEFCKHIWTKRRLARHAAWHVVRDEWREYFGWLKKRPVNQVPSTEWTMIDSKVVLCRAVATVSLILLKTRFCTAVQYRCIFVLVIWTLLCVIWTLPRELNNKL